MDVADIHLQDHNQGAWLLVIEGIAEMFTDSRAIAGSGVGSWIGTGYGARDVRAGLVMPAELHLGETLPWQAEVRSPSPAAFTLVDLAGDLVALFTDYEPDDSTDTLGQRISPLDDPAADPVVGIGGELVTVWDRNVATERIGPAGQRRWFWITPGTAPPGLDHFAATGWPAVRTTDAPSLWAGRKVAVYRIVKDPDTGTWPSWEDQHDGNSLWWVGTFVDRSDWDHHEGGGGYSGRAITVHAHGQASWLERSLGLSRPSEWLPISAGVTLTGDELKVAVWVAPIEGETLGDGINYTDTKYEAHTLNSGDDLTGLDTVSEIWTAIRDIAYTTVDGTDHGAALAANNATWTGPTAPLSFWSDTNDKRRVRISPNGSTIEIKCEPDAPKLGFRLGIAVDARAAQAAGWDITRPPWGPRDSLVPDGVLPVGGTDWGELAGGEILPPFHVIGLFSTRDEWPDEIQPSYLWDNNGWWKKYTAPYAGGTFTLDHEGGTTVFVGFGAVRCEGQHGNPYTLGGQIDGADIDAAGWWAFRGKRLRAADFLAGITEPSDYVGVAFCSWVATPTGDAVEVNNDGVAALLIERWEDPRRFGIPHDPLLEPWTAVAGGIEAVPLSVLAGQAIGGPGWRHRAIVTTLLSTGTSLWDEGGNLVTITPGDNHPPDMPPSEIAGDIEVADLGLGIPYEFVDWQSFYLRALALPGGVGGALNRVLYPVLGTEKASTLLRELMAGAGWAWSIKRRSAGVVPAFGAYDPLATIDPAEVVATLRRSDHAEPGVTLGPQWRGRVEARRDGPFDRFVLEVGGDPTGGTGDTHTRSYESTDHGRRARSGRIVFPVRDRGLRDPAPWIGQPPAQLYDWTEQARVRFASGFGPRLAKQHRIYRAVFNGRWSGLLGLGDAVHVIDPSAESADGTRGVNHRGRIVDASIITGKTGRTSLRLAIELERNSVDQVHVWGPLAYSGRGGWDSGAGILTIDTDTAFAGGDHDDSLGFTVPDWTSYAAGNFRVTIYQSENGATINTALTVTAEVSAAVTTALTLTAISGTLLRDTVKLVVGREIDDQTAEWASEIFAPICAPSGLYNGVDKGIRIK